MRWFRVGVVLTLFGAAMSSGCCGWHRCCHRHPIREALHRRALPGEGILELHRFADTLLDRGWDGTVSVEVLSAQLRGLPVDELVGRLHASTAPYWS